MPFIILKDRYNHMLILRGKRGGWESTGGGKEKRDKDDLAAAKREFFEESGARFPENLVESIKKLHLRTSQGTRVLFVAHLQAGHKIEDLPGFRENKDSPRGGPIPGGHNRWRHEDCNHWAALSIEEILNNPDKFPFRNGFFRQQYVEAAKVSPPGGGHHCVETNLPLRDDDTDRQEAMCPECARSGVQKQCFPGRNYCGLDCGRAAKRRRLSHAGSAKRRRRH